ncbi:MAG: hypothetical protein C4292_03350 [Nitrososphaera sp.]
MSCQSAATGHTVKNILYDRNVTFKVGSRAFKGIARPVSQEEETGLAAQVSKLMDSKYGWSQGLTVELEPQAQGNNNTVQR